MTTPSAAAGFLLEGFLQQRHLLDAVNAVDAPEVDRPPAGPGSQTG